MSDQVGKFSYDGKFFQRYAPFFEAAKSLPDDAVVLVIGANDGVCADPSARVWRDGWRGYFVEPNPQARAALEHNRRGVVLPVAVSATPGVIRLWTMTPEAAKAYERIGANGTCLTSFNRDHIASRILLNMPQTAARLGVENMIVPIDVPAMPVKDLGIPAPDLVQIDVEGMEPEIVPQCFGASVILWEHQHEANKGALEDLARQAGYTVTRLKNDSLAVQC